MTVVCLSVVEFAGSSVASFLGMAMGLALSSLGLLIRRGSRGSLRLVTLSSVCILDYERVVRDYVGVHNLYCCVGVSIFYGFHYIMLIRGVDFSKLCPRRA